MDIILSIKPKYADAIFRGEKTIELRRKIWKPDNFDYNTNKVFVYASKHFGKIVGEFEIKGIIEFTPDIYSYFSFKDVAFITERDYMYYFKNCKTAYAIEIDNPVYYRDWVDIREYRIKTPPQNFCYMRGKREIIGNIFENPELLIK